MKSISWFNRWVGKISPFVEKKIERERKRKIYLTGTWKKGSRSPYRHYPVFSVPEFEYERRKIVERSRKLDELVRISQEIGGYD